MKKLLSLVLAVLFATCMLTPSCALADNVKDLAESAKRMIEITGRDNVTEYAYTNVLGILLVALAEHNDKTLQSYITLFGGLSSAGENAAASSLTNMLSWSQEIGLKYYRAIIKDAAKCYEENKYNFDVLEKYVDILLIDKAP